MSEQEFEVYLRLIARLLRLSDAQREAISDEMRDHMEARLDELMESGMGREEAIHAAIDEFGDAAGLADEFTRVTRYHKLRRRIMRTSIGALSAAAAIALTFLFMLPQNRPGVSGLAESFAQDQVVTEDAITASTREASDTLDRLSQRITVDYGQTPLGGVIDHLRDETGVNIFVNWTVLELAGIDADYPVSLQLNDVSADTVLSLILRLINPGIQTQIDYMVMDDVVMVTTADELGGLRVVRIYDCVDLMKPEMDAEASAMAEPEPAGGMGGEGGYGMGGGMGMGGGEFGGYGGRRGQSAFGFGPADNPMVRSNELIAVVHTLLGVDGSVSSYDGMLVVVAGHKTHQRIHETLNLMREARARR